MLKAIVFDFDGVIADTEPLHFEAFRDVLGGCGVPLTERDYADRYIGYDDVGVFQAVGVDRELNWTDAAIAALVSRKAERMAALLEGRSVLFEDAADTVRRVAAELPIAIASGALKREIVFVLEREGLLDAFAVIVAAEDTSRSKPSPDPYVRALADLGNALGRNIAAADAIAIEDTRPGLESARAAGLLTVAVERTLASDELMIADLVIPDLRSLNVAQLKKLLSAERKTSNELD
jgi:beta-phosphoglucomutase